MNKRRVVITGLGVATPLGISVADVWERLLRGESGIKKLDCTGCEKSEVRAAGVIDDEDFHILKTSLEDIHEEMAERRTVFGLWAAREALRDAGFSENIDSDNAGVVFAAGLGVNRLEDISNFLDESGRFDRMRFFQELKNVSKDSIVRCTSNLPAALIGKAYGLKGVNSTITTACASATQAIGTAFRLIQSGEADIMLAGGADSMINPVGLVYFVLLGAASTSDEPPETVCKPFDRRRSGLVMGEGAGAVVLESEDHARTRGARIYAELAGYGSSMDAYQVTAPEPKGGGAELSMKKAIEDAFLVPEDIDYINAHGTGTKLNDIAETEAIKRVFSEHAGKIAISSSKSMIGHLLAASGGPEFVFTTLSVYNNWVHPTINLTRRDLKCDLDYVSDGSRQMEVRAAISNSFGFGGQNGSVVVKKFTTV